jgi:predicted  nucleic acid-binding Zn-ribbon protein
MADSVVQNSDDLAKAALAEASGEGTNAALDEAAASDQLAETLTSLQNLIEKHARELTRINSELKEKRESMKSVFENDVQLEEAKAEVERQNVALKERKSQLQSDPQVTSLKVDIAELNEQKKELEETLSNHLVNYHALTNSTSFDTSDGDQWEFNIKAKIKGKKMEKTDN